MNTSLIALIFIVLIVAWYWSQIRFKNKMLCYFLRPNKQRIKKWVPLYNTWVVFDRGKYGIGRYYCDTNCITMEWFDAGINKLFPTLVPTLEFRWDTPYPLDPANFETTWQTPEVVESSWQAHSHTAFARGAAQQVAKKSRLPEWLVPAVGVVLTLVILYMIYQLNGQIQNLDMYIHTH